MKHSGKAWKAAFRMIFWTLLLLLAVFAIGILGSALAAVVAAVSVVLIAVWVLFAIFTVFFFRDPNPSPPGIQNAIVAPAHGRVDVIDDLDEPEVMGGHCQRISIFLSIFSVHVQAAPVAGVVSYVKHTPGKFLSATRSANAHHNENALIGLDCRYAPGKRVALRQIAGLIARRIVTWVELGETLERSDRIGLIQYGSRVDLYMPMDVKIHCKLGDKVKGGETIVASFP